MINLWVAHILRNQNYHSERRSSEGFWWLREALLAARPSNASRYITRLLSSYIGVVHKGGGGGGVSKCLRLIPGGGGGLVVD